MKNNRTIKRVQHLRGHGGLPPYHVKINLTNFLYYVVSRTGYYQRNLALFWVPLFRKLHFLCVPLTGSLLWSPKHGWLVRELKSHDHYLRSNQTQLSNSHNWSVPMWRSTSKDTETRISECRKRFRDKKPTPSLFLAIKDQKHKTLV